MGSVPRLVHGVVEYVVGILFIAAPILFDFDSGTATGVSIAVGVFVLVLTASTAGLPTSLRQQLALTAHITVDYVLAIFLVAAPFILGFADEDAPRNFFMVIGVIYLLMTIGTRFKERTEQAAAG